ncbi:WD repeat-containing protein 47 [Holothuria leucospilota]|uniref:WD repeat-containing protein 47 n=1 Tax=Holothuria leucospilota TaxID=206669 RepID=A0A9Q1HAH9_HOLLE|nr:WD repeat-containing protein 47 [Holothuria leucospilota]
MLTPLQVSVKEKDVLCLILDFLKQKELYLSMRAVERESGVVNGLFSEDALFLRQLILDGQWDDVLEFIQPVERIDSFDSKKFRYLILKHKLLEMLCMRSEDVEHLQIEFSTEEVVSSLNELEPYCPSKEDYNSLCLLLTLPRLSDHSSYKDWSPSSARVQCFEDAYPLISRFLPVEKKLKEQDFTSSKDRLVQLLIKGMLFESCVDFCQQKATGKDIGDVTVNGMLHGTEADDSDLSLLSWLQSIPKDAFNCPFEQRSLKLDVQAVIKPSTSWSEQIMTPMTPTPGSKARPSPSPTTPTLYRSRPWSSNNRALSQSLSATLETALLNQVQKNDDQALPDTNVLSRSFANFHVSDATFSGSLPPVAEGLERHPGVSGKPPGVVNQSTPRSSREAPEDLKQSRERLQREWQEQERRRQILQQQLTQATGSSTSSISSGLGTEFNQSAVDGRIPSSNQKTPPEMAILRPSKVDSSTPKVNTFDPRSTPSPNASPILTKPVSKMISSTQADDTLSASLPRHLNLNSHGSEKSSLKSTNQTYVKSSSQSRNEGSHAEGALQPDMFGLDSRSSEENVPWTPPIFTPVSTLEDVQAIRAVTFDPTGEFYAVGSNSKTLRICRNSGMRRDDSHQPTVLFKRMRHHKGSIYCIAWSPHNNLVATGSNDKLIKLVQFDPDSCNAVGPDTDLTFHDGTVRDVVFQTSATRGAVLISGGAGDCNIYVTDCQKGQPMHAMSGHTGHVLSLYSLDELLVSGSQDSTVRMWDLRTPRCVQVIGTPGSDAGQGSVAAAVTVDRSGRLIASGQEDSTCMLYDIRGGRVLQNYQPHKGEIRSVRFSPKGYFLLSGSYDGNIVMSNLTGDLMKPVDFGVVGQHQDKVIQCRWHPNQPSFLSSSADRTVTLWCLDEGT